MGSETGALLRVHKCPGFEAGLWARTRPSSPPPARASDARATPLLNTHSQELPAVTHGPIVTQGEKERVTDDVNVTPSPPCKNPLAGTSCVAWASRLAIGGLVPSSVPGGQQWPFVGLRWHTDKRAPPRACSTRPSAMTTASAALESSSEYCHCGERASSVFGTKINTCIDEQSNAPPDLSIPRTNQCCPFF